MICEEIAGYNALDVDVWPPPITPQCKQLLCMKALRELLPAVFSARSLYYGTMHIAFGYLGGAGGFRVVVRDLLE